MATSVAQNKLPPARVCLWGCVGGAEGMGCRGGAWHSAPPHTAPPVQIRPGRVLPLGGSAVSRSPPFPAGALLASPSRPEHLRERLSHDAAGPGHVGSVCRVDADRYVRRGFRGDQHVVSQPLSGPPLPHSPPSPPVPSSLSSLLLASWLASSSYPCFRFQNTVKTRVVSGFLSDSEEHLVGCGFSLPRR